jgi:hypothetical protein
MRTPRACVSTTVSTVALRGEHPLGPCPGRRGGRRRSSTPTRADRRRPGPAARPRRAGRRPARRRRRRRPRSAGPGPGRRWSPLLPRPASPGRLGRRRSTSRASTGPHSISTPRGGSRRSRAGTPTDLAVGAERDEIGGGEFGQRGPAGSGPSPALGCHLVRHGSGTGLVGDRCVTTARRTAQACRTAVPRLRTPRACGPELGLSVRAVCPARGGRKVSPIESVGPRRRSGRSTTRAHLAGAAASGS